MSQRRPDLEKRILAAARLLDVAGRPWDAKLLGTTHRQASRKVHAEKGGPGGLNAVPEGNHACRAEGRHEKGGEEDGLIGMEKTGRTCQY